MKWIGLLVNARGKYQGIYICTHIYIYKRKKNIVIHWASELQLGKTKSDARCEPSVYYRGIIFLRIWHSSHARLLLQFTRTGVRTNRPVRTRPPPPWYMRLNARTHARTQARTSVETKRMRTERRGRRGHERGTGRGREITRGRKRERGGVRTIRSLASVSASVNCTSLPGCTAALLARCSQPPHSPPPARHGFPRAIGRTCSRSHHGAIVCSAVHAVCHHSRRWRRMPSEFRHESTARGFSIEVSRGAIEGGGRAGTRVCGRWPHHLRVVVKILGDSCLKKLRNARVIILTGTRYNGYVKYSAYIYASYRYM